MAINEVLFPTTPNPVSGDWALAIELIEHAYKNINNPLQVDGSNVPQGAVFQVGGNVYHADSATAITGTASDYVKLTVSGTTLVPTFVADLTGVTWNSLWSGYYDGSGNLYVFDEVKAILAGDLVGGNSKFAELWNNNFDQSLKTTDDVEFSDIVYKSRKITSANYIHSNSTSTEDDIFNKLSPFIPNIGETIIVNGTVYMSGQQYSLHFAYRDTATDIIIYGYDMASPIAAVEYTVVEGSSAYKIISIAW